MRELPTIPRRAFRSQQSARTQGYGSTTTTGSRTQSDFGVGAQAREPLSKTFGTDEWRGIYRGLPNRPLAGRPRSRDATYTRAPGDRGVATDTRSGPTPASLRYGVGPRR